MALRDEIADALSVIRSSKDSEPSEEDYDDADFIIQRLLRNRPGLLALLGDATMPPRGEMSNRLRWWGTVPLKEDVAEWWPTEPEPNIDADLLSAADYIDALEADRS